MFVHKLVLAFLLPIKLAFEDKIGWASVGFDFYLDFVFFIEICVTFKLPLLDSSGRYITEPKKIAITYLRTWFFIDLLVCFPLYFLKLTS